MLKLKKEFNKKKKDIKAKLSEFKNIWLTRNESKAFEEIIFCLLTPQTNALKADKTIKELKEKKLLWKNKKSISKILKKNGVRFHNKKAENIVLARKKFYGKTIKKIEELYLKAEKNSIVLRDLLIKEVKGFGLKEASHFLRNIGLAFDLAILDRHILKNMKALHLIKEIPKHLNKKEYLKIERKLLMFAKKQKMQIQELDLFFWAKETGIIFK